MADTLSTPDGSLDRLVFSHTHLAFLAFGLLVMMLAWAPFPLGSVRAWSSILLLLLIAVCWALFSASLWRAPQHVELLRRLTLPIVLYMAALLWAAFQTASWVPSSWMHPVWTIASEGLGEPIQGSISLNPWRTQSSLVMLLGFGLVSLLVAMMTRNRSRAAFLLDALIAIGGFYAAYAFFMSLIGLAQDEIFYSTRSVAGVLAAPFVNRNSLATYLGLITLCGLVRLVELGSQSVVATLGWRPFALSLLQFLFGRGTFALIATLLAFSAVVATGSRAGFLATLSAMLVLVFLAASIARQRMALGWAAATGVVLVVSATTLFVVNGETLAERLSALVETQTRDDFRVILWDAAQRMIADAPFLGLGLGTFESAYPLYAERNFPFIMDKTHNDYLELAAGLGLPATFALLTALGLLALRCLRGVFIRRRDRQFAMLGFAATVLVGIHSIFDFSLQIPAIALTFATILGLGVAQSFPSRDV